MDWSTDIACIKDSDVLLQEYCSKAGSLAGILYLQGEIIGPNIITDLNVQYTHINAGEKNKNAYKNCIIWILLGYNSI